nr:hypothetical protein [Tanacetum cinerariifolium]
MDSHESVVSDVNVSSKTIAGNSVSKFVNQSSSSSKCLIFLVGISSLLKCTYAIHQLTYGVVPDFLDEHLPEYLRKPTMTNVVKLYWHHEEKHGFSGMLGSLDFTDWKWFDCPYGYKGQYVRRDNGDKPPKNKVQSSGSKGTASSNAVSSNRDQSASNSFTNEKYKRLMALISDKTGSSSIPANIAVDHPNGTKAIVTHVGRLRLTDKIVIHDVLVVPGYEASLLSVHKLSRDNKFRVLFYEDVCVIQDSVQRTQVGASNESNRLYFVNTGKKHVNNNIEVC